MPVGYTDYSFNVLAESCKIWYYELQSSVPEGKAFALRLCHVAYYEIINITYVEFYENLPIDKTKEYYTSKCGEKKSHLVDPCSSVKFNEVLVNVSQAVAKTKYALERMGHAISPWLETVNNGGWMT